VVLLLLGLEKIVPKVELCTHRRMEHATLGFISVHKIPSKAGPRLSTTTRNLKKIYVFYDLEWVPGIVGEDVKTVTLTATCGGSPAIRLSQSGPTNTTSGKFYFMEDGKVLGARGHLHDGGVKVSMFLNDKFTCASNAIYGEKGAEEGGMGGSGHSHGGGSSAAGAASIKTISSMTGCAGPFPVKKGDTLKLVAEYDLSKHPLRSTGSGKAADVMGMMGIYFSANK